MPQIPCGARSRERIRSSLCAESSKKLVAGLSTEAEVGLVAYGHRQKGDCEDIETLVPLGALDKEAMTREIDALDPKGKTPINKRCKRSLAPSLASTLYFA